MKQTAVQQLQEYLAISLGPDRMRMLANEFEKAKEIEKDQIVDAFSEGTKMIDVNDEMSAMFNGIIYYGENYENRMDL